MTKEEAINTIISVGCDTNKISDGYHTFEQLYEHRVILYMALCQMIEKYRHYDNIHIWMSELHSDGSKFEGWFILGINSKKGEQISYHLPMSKWNACTEFAEVLGYAPEFDGHTSDDVLARLCAVAGI